MNLAIFLTYGKNNDMRKITLILIILSLGLSVNAQKSWNIYKNTYGIPEVTPSKTIKPNPRGGYDCLLFNHIPWTIMNMKLENNKNGQ